MAALLLNLQAPLMSFGGPQVDHFGPTGRFPTLSMVTGLFGNALGYTHGDASELQLLQTRIRLASALLCPGTELEDFQTVDLGQQHLGTPAWTTWGRTEHRAGGPAARFGTHIRRRFYRAGAKVLAAVTLEPANESPTLTELAEALDQPSRPLFFGRKTCLPAAPIRFGLDPTASDLVEALRNAPTSFPQRWRDAFASAGGAPVLVERPVPDERVLTAAERPQVRRVVDQRDWAHQLHGGERVVLHERIELERPEPEAAGPT